MQVGGTGPAMAGRCGGMWGSPPPGLVVGGWCWRAGQGMGLPPPRQRLGGGSTLWPHPGAWQGGTRPSHLPMHAPSCPAGLGSRGCSPGAGQGGQVNCPPPPPTTTTTWVQVGVLAQGCRPSGAQGSCLLGDCQPTCSHSYSPPQHWAVAEAAAGGSPCL